jgi:glycosyltransferase involved in cell wall biosynthesis
MAGLPVVAGDTPEIRRVVEAAAAGVLVDPLDSDDIASALNEMWADEDRRRQMSAKALEAARRYCWEEEAPRLLEIYQSL